MKDSLQTDCLCSRLHELRGFTQTEKKEAVRSSRFTYEVISVKTSSDFGSDVAQSGVRFGFWLFDSFLLSAHVAQM